MKKTWMLDTNICSFIMREQPAAVLKRLEQVVLRGDRIVVSAVTYAEMRFGATGPKASPRHIQLVDAFCARLDAILPWDRAAVDATTDIRVALRLAGTPIGPNDTAIAGHAIAAGAILVTNNTREFERVPGLVLEDWVSNVVRPLSIGLTVSLRCYLYSFSPLLNGSTRIRVLSCVSFGGLMNLDIPSWTARVHISSE
jgi:tRNA(fMet)-specific endonuclease VapC